MPTYKGADTTDLLTADNIRGLAFIGKYCADTPSFPDKRLTHSEKASLKAAGIPSFFLYERGNTADYFTGEQGAADAAATVAYFQELGVPAGIPCFACYDDDFSPSQIMAYALAFHDEMKSSGYLAGAYGSGLVLGVLLAAGIIHYSMLSNAKGWQGYDDFLGKQDILQLTGSVNGLNSDPDEATSLDGWSWL